jgi:serine/threonine protein kinase
MASSSNENFKELRLRFPDVEREIIQDALNANNDVSAATRLLVDWGCKPSASAATAPPPLHALPHALYSNSAGSPSQQPPANQQPPLVNSSFSLNVKLRLGLKIIQRRDVQLTTGFPSQSGAHGCVQQGLLEGMLVAVKTPLQCSLTERDFNKFIDELTISASVRHPNCVAVLAACHDRADPMYVMEWMSGGSLHEMLGKVPPAPMHVRLRNAREIASAVEYLHQRLITHGDLKSLNVMLTSDLIAKVCDFGAAIQRLTSAMSMKSSQGAQVSASLVSEFINTDITVI